MTQKTLSVLASMALLACAAPPDSAAAKAGGAPEVVVYMADLPKNAFYELEPWKDAASPGGKLVGVTNHGGELDPPPENDPHVVFKVTVQGGVPYRCWLHMKVGKAKGKGLANRVYAQFTGAVNASGKDVYKPRTDSYLTLQGPTTEGWTWVGAGGGNGTVTFRSSGTVTVRLQAGMEGVGFDQLVLSPARYLEKAPAEAIVKK